MKDAIRRGDLLPAALLPCADCGETAQAYDHYSGYADALAVEPVCHECHGYRSRERGEHRGTRVPLEVNHAQ